MTNQSTKGDAMVETIYRCEICGAEFETKKQAEKCEEQGVPEQEIKIGADVRTLLGDETVIGTYIKKHTHERIYMSS